MQRQKQSGLYGVAIGRGEARKYFAGPAIDGKPVLTAHKNLASGGGRGETISILAYWRRELGRNDIFCVRIL